MIDVYYTPEKFGLEIIGYVEWGSGGYEYDRTTVWQQTSTGRLYYGDSAGCSCSTPYEGWGIDDLTVAPNGTVIVAVLVARNSEEKGKQSWVYEYSRESEIALIAERLHERGVL